MSRSGLKRPWSLAVVGVAGVLVLSMGGAVVAAPLSLPLLYLVVGAEDAGGGLRTAAAVVAAVTAAEIAWSAVVLALAAPLWVWLLPVAAGLGAAAALARRPARLDAA